MVYLSSSQIFQSQYNLEEEFPFIFAGLAISIGAAVFKWNIGYKYGMEKLITSALISFFVVSATYVGLFYDTANQMFLFCCCFAFAIL
jgi:DHA1 family bicyclomycin/chloramphenicol resistance-like MFS transporter